MHSVGDLYKIQTPKDLERIFESINGYKYWHLLRGEELAQEETKSSSISQSKVLVQGEKLPRNTRDIVMHLALKASQRLRFKNFTTNEVTLYLRLINKQTFKQSQKIIRSSDSHTISKALLACFDKILKISKQTLIQKVSLVLTNLDKPSNQLSLLDFAGAKKKNNVSKLLMLLMTNTEPIQSH
jgi:nucleotidyltransferase/DNA polymerase involved in DNA repair